MTQDNRTASLLLRFVSDTAGANQVSKDTDRMASEFGSLSDLLTRLNTTIAGLGEFGFTKEQIDSLTRINDVLVHDTVAAAGFRRELERLTAQSERLNSVAVQPAVNLNQTEFMRNQITSAHEAAIEEDRQRTASLQNVNEILQKITQEMSAQLPLAERLAQAERFRETGLTADLRSDAFGAGAAALTGGRRVNSPENVALQESLRRARQGIVALPAIGPASPIPRTLQFAEAAVKGTNASLGQLAAASGLAGIAVVGLAVAFSEMTRIVEDNRSRLNSAIAVQEDYYDAVGELTTLAARTQLAELERNRPLLEAELQNTTDAINNTFRSISESGQGAIGNFLADAGARVLFRAFTPTGGLEEAQKAQQDALQQNIDLTTRLSQGMLEGAFAQNDFNDQIDRYLNVLLDADKLTEEGRDKRRAEIQREIEVMTEIASTAGLSVDAQAEYAVQLAHLLDEYEFLGEVTDSYADQLEREAAAKERVLDLASQLLEIDQLDAAARQEQIEANQRTIAINEAAIRLRGGESAEGSAELVRQNEELEFMNNLLGSIVDTTGDLTTAQELHDELTKANVEAVNTQVQQFLDAQNMTKAEREREVEVLQLQIDKLVDLRNTENITAEASAELTAQIHDLEDQQKLLTETSDSYADQLEREEQLKKNLEEAGQNLVDAYELEGKARDDLIKAQEEFRQAEAKHIQENNDIEAERQRKVGDAVKDREKAEEKLRTESSDKLTEALVKIQEDSDRRILEIRRKGTLTLERLIARGDQAAAIEALEDQAFAIAEEKRKRAEAEEERKEETEKSLDDQLQTIRERYDEQVEAANSAAQRALDAEKRRWDGEKAQREKAIQDAEAAYQSAAAAVLALEDYYRSLQYNNTNAHGSSLVALVDRIWSNVSAVVGARLTDIYNKVATAPVNYSQYGSGTTYPFSVGNNQQTQQDRDRQAAIDEAYRQYYLRMGITNSNDARQWGGGGFDSGGYNTMPGMYWSGVPEVHVPMADINRFSSGDRYDVTINGSSLNESQLRRAITQGIQAAKPRLKEEISSEMSHLYGQKRQRVGGG